MTVKTITFKRNVQVKPYESASFEVTAEVMDGEVAEAVAIGLREFVEEQLDYYVGMKERELAPF